MYKEILTCRRVSNTKLPDPARPLSQQNQRPLGLATQCDIRLVISPWEPGKDGEELNNAQNIRFERLGDLFRSRECHLELRQGAERLRSRMTDTRTSRHTFSTFVISSKLVISGTQTPLCISLNLVITQQTRFKRLGNRGRTLQKVDLSLKPWYCSANSL